MDTMLTTFDARLKVPRLYAYGGRVTSAGCTRLAASAKALDRSDPWPSQLESPQGNHGVATVQLSAASLAEMDAAHL